MYLVLALLLQGAPAEPQPDLQQVLKGVFARAQRDADRQVAGARWIKGRTDEDISDPLRTKTEHTERYSVWGDGTRVLQRKTVRDGKNVSDRPAPLPLFINCTFLEQFDYVFAVPAQVPCDTGECWRLDFVPKAGAFPETGDLEQLMMGSTSGTLLVDSASYGILRADARTLQPYKSFAVDIFWFSVSLTQVPVDGTMVTATIEISYAFDPLFGGPKTKRRFYEYSDVVLPPSHR